ncbi:hypothetical protein N7447_004612 [Penicillium robsamsonii]|uniref:uncharacterized protein n=1 Tax=Penicillium robsamsonii TaxID=1792511 RepID=UPI002548EAFB|nr:uncharacterized protein N7447_004612 [Penicillium robsamsonii]KAJ5827849.1 hypothetical protein N7447_004612 [Penicillium robsamsonii]
MTSIVFGDQNQGLQVGASHGPIYYTSEQPEPRPEPLSTVPFPHDPDFVSREELDQIHEKCSIPGSRIVLVGLGGVGKSRLAIEYCHRVRQQSPDTWVFWVHASNAARCEESLRNLADRTKIPGRQDRNSNIFQLFGNWLQDGEIGNWILVLDNVDDDELLRKPLSTQMEAQANTRHAPTQPPLRYLLGCSNGSTIITSRNRGVALELAGHKKHLIDVQPMNTAEALVLLRKKLDDCTEREELVRLVKELEFMPLAIVQAASYINHRSPRCSASQYLEKLRRSERQAANLLNQEGYNADRDWEAKNSILLTWQISFDHIRRIRQSAADLLSLMSFFDWQGIPEDLLRVQDIDRNCGTLGSPQDIRDMSSDEDTDYSSEPDVDDDFESDIAILRDYSFITSGGDIMMFTMHRLVQLTVRTWLRTYGQEEEWKECFIKNLYGEFPTGQYENWGRCRSLFPHVRSAMLHQPKSQDSLRNWAALLYKGAWYATECGSISVAEDMAAMSRKQRMKICGAEDEDTLHSTAMLGVAYRLQGRWEEAEQLELQVMETSKTKLGEDHPDTLTSMANLASTLWNQGRWEEAEQLFIQVMETSKTKLGAAHPDMLTSMANLASTLWNQGRWEEAEQLELQVMETSRTKLGADHPDTLTSMANLASTYRNQGRWEEAEELELEVMETSRTKLGADHPDTLTSMANLASTYRNQGRWEEAEELELEVMETSRTKLGADHPDTLTSMANLASTLWNQGRWDEAEQLFIQVIETRKMKLGADHPSTLISMANLASTLWNQGRWDEAEQVFIQVIETRKMKLGADHPSTLISMANLASTYRNQGRWEEAEELELQVMETSKTKLGADHPNTLTSMANLASTYRNQGRWEEAEQLFIQVIETRKTKLGADHPSTLTSMANLASTYRNQGRWEEAEELELQVMETSKTKLGADHPDTLTSMANLASTLWNQGRWEEAEQVFIQVMETSRMKLGADHPSTLTSMTNLAFTWESTGQHAKAVDLLQTCVVKQQRVLGPSHPHTVSNDNTLLEWKTAHLTMKA